MNSSFPPLFILWNLAAFLMVMLDKRRARRNEWRIREQTFFVCAAAFGASGILLGMYVFRHKTRHRYADCRQTGEIHYGFTQFRPHYYQYAQQNKATMHIEHKPGYAVEVDWAGVTLSDIDNSTGEIQKAYLFVGALPCSGYA